MKKLSLLAVVMSVLFGFSVSWAGPFLVCDPPADPDSVETYEIFKDGILLADGIPKQPDGSVRYDLDGTTPGRYTFTAKACNAVWGCSGLSNPYVSPPGAGNPSNLRMAP
jgi:hypothetical protein